MSKVYLLLRNNKQSGPHTLEELLKLSLKPLDLIWIEGKSFGWSYPSEINALKPFVTPPVETPGQPASGNQGTPPVNNQAYMPAEKQSDPAPARKVYVSMPATVNRTIETKKQEAETVTPDTADKIEQKAEELRKRIQSYVPKVKIPSRMEEPVITKFQSTLPEREEEYTSWIYNQKLNKAKNSTEEQKKWAAIAVAALLILIAGFGISQYHKDIDKKEVALTTSTETPEINKTVPEPLITEPETPAIQPIIENNVDNNSPSNTSSGIAEKMVSNTKAVEKPVKEIHKIVPVAEAHKKPLVNKTSEKETVVKVPAEIKTNTSELKTILKKEPETAAAAPKKKKTLNEKVDAFFSRFSRRSEEPKATVPDNTPQADNTGSFPGTVERKAVHRDDKQVVASPHVTTNLADFVEVTTNKPSENWMLGVHGLKVSLRNSGNETVKTAEVELRYYSEQNEVLEKKIMNFNNILPGKTVTLPAPDHRLADHTDFRLVTAK